MGISTDMFVKSYKANSKAKSETFKEFIKKHITTSYIPYSTKYLQCTDVVNKTTRRKDGDIEIIRVDSAMQYLFSNMKLIELYTDIEIDKTKIMDEYDKLNEIGAIDELINAIPPTECAEFSAILGMKMDDFYRNEYSLEALLYNTKESFSISEEVINSVLDEVKNKIELPN